MNTCNKFWWQWTLNSSYALDNPPKSIPSILLIRPVLEKVIFNHHFEFCQKNENLFSKYLHNPPCYLKYWLCGSVQKRFTKLKDQGSIRDLRRVWNLGEQDNEWITAELTIDLSLAYAKMLQMRGRQSKCSRYGRYWPC